MKHYRKNGDQYSFYNSNTLIIGLGAILLLFSIRGLLYYDLNRLQHFNDYLRALAPVWLIVAFFCLGTGTRQMTLHPLKQQLSADYLFGLYRQVYQIEFPLHLEAVPLIRNSKNSGVEVWILTQKGRVKLQSYPSRHRNRVTGFMEETRQILS